MDKNLKNLMGFCVKNIKSATKMKDLEKYLPIKDEKMWIYLLDEKLFFFHEEQVSHLWNENGYFSNLQILKRIAYPFGIEIKKEDIFSVATFAEKIKKILSEEEKKNEEN